MDDPRRFDLIDPKYKWEVSAYYNDTVKIPKLSGQLALVTVHTDDMSKDLEVKVLSDRSDIGNVLVRPLWN